MKIKSHDDFRFVTGFRQKLLAKNSCVFHMHENIEIVYHPSGSDVTRILPEKFEFRFGPGSVVIYPPFTEHDQRMDTEGEDYCVILQQASKKNSWPDTPLYISEISDPCAIHELSSLSSTNSPPDETHRQMLDARSKAVMISLAIEKRIHERSKKIVPGESHVRKAIRHIRQNLSEVTNIADIAEAVGISGEHLRHIFVRQTGTTLNRYLTEARIQRATELLVYTPLPLKAIAESCGYRNERYFCSAYKKATGSTPGMKRLKKTPRITE